MTGLLRELPLVNASQRDAILRAPRTSAAHRTLLRSLPAMNALQAGGQTTLDVLPAETTVVAWNLERCLFPGASAAHLHPVAPHVVLLSEMDHGMARTAQRHTTEEMAAALGMSYVFGVEFYEMDLGGETERTFCEDDYNARGWHGNAVLSAVPIQEAVLIRLDDHGHWFSAETGADPGQPRVGGRNAIAAILPGATGPLCFVSTHLESNADGVHRAGQFDRLMDAVDTFAPNLPIVIGGDLNTGNHMPPHYHWQEEPLFARAEARGYDWSANADGFTTRPSLITNHPARQMKLDWICVRGATPSAPGILSSLGTSGHPLSDHDAVHVNITA